MNITSAKYCKNIETNENQSIKVTIDSVEMFVPISEGNTHYNEFMRQENEVTLTVTAASD